MYKRSSIIETIEKVETQFSMKEEGLEYYNKKTQPLIFLLSTLMLLYNTVVVMLGYNWIIPNITNLPPISYIQALLLDFFITFMVMPKMTDEDFYERSFVYRIARMIYIFAVNTFILIFMFILQLFI